MPPAARLTDMHVCPMVTGIVPHVGGPITAPGAPTVLIEFLPAARMTDMATCVGPPDMIAMGSPTVLIEFLMAARIGDPTAHGGVIVLGAPTVEIGEAGMGSPSEVMVTPPPGGGGGGGRGWLQSRQRACRNRRQGDYRRRGPDGHLDTRPIGGGPGRCGDANDGAGHEVGARTSAGHKRAEWNALYRAVPGLRGPDQRGRFCCVN